ncbi:MAG: hypothetical protein IIV90_00520, partial [Oscillospiraceae bacterium]|nr:hypothetical protein [Oscillospiraceae bacterium]
MYTKHPCSSFFQKQKQTTSLQEFSSCKGWSAFFAFILPVLLRFSFGGAPPAFCGRKPAPF